jgi:hypothetical protein
MTQSHANHSPRENSLINKEKTGNFTVLSHFARRCSREVRVVAALFNPIPYYSEQGIPIAHQGNQIP